LSALEAIDVPDDAPQEIVHRDKDGNETREYLPPRMDATLVVNAAMLDNNP
jgi:hypothetical protein